MPGKEDGRAARARVARAHGVVVVDGWMDGDSGRVKNEELTYAWSLIADSIDSKSAHLRPVLNCQLLWLLTSHQGRAKEGS